MNTTPPPTAVALATTAPNKAKKIIGQESRNSAIGSLNALANTNAQTRKTGNRKTISAFAILIEFNLQSLVHQTKIKRTKTYILLQLLLPTDQVLKQLLTGVLLVALLVLSMISESVATLPTKLPPPRSI